MTTVLNLLHDLFAGLYGTHMTSLLHACSAHMTVHLPGHMTVHMTDHMTDHMLHLPQETLGRLPWSPGAFLLQ